MIVPVDYSLLQDIGESQYLVIVRVNDEQTDLDDRLVSASGKYGRINLLISQDRTFSFSYDHNGIEGKEEFQVEINNGDHWHILIFPDEYHEVYWWTIGREDWERVI